MDDRWKKTLNDYITLVAGEWIQNISDASELQSRCDEFLLVVRSTLATLKQSWNHASPDFTNRLPEEILAECFSWLDLRGLVLVSSVSGSWRAVALNHPHLWCDVRMVVSLPVDMWMIRTVIQRAGAHPLDLRLRLDGLAYENALSQLVFQLSDRIRSLTINNSTQLILSELQAQDGRIPYLRQLDVGKFSFSDAILPFHLLQYFKGSVSGNDIRNFSQLFPNLVSLDLSGRSDVPSLPSKPIPPSLLYLTLHIENQDLTDYLHLHWDGHPLHTLSLMRERHLTAALDLLLRLDFIIHDLELGSRDIQIRDSGHRIISIINCSSPRTVLVQYADMLKTRFTNLRRLSVSHAFEEFVSVGFELPSLESLILEDPWIPQLANVTSTSRLYVPVLRALTLRFSTYRNLSLTTAFRTIAHFGQESCDLQVCVSAR